MNDSFATRDTLRVGHQTYEIFNLRKLNEQYAIARLPGSLKILLENLLRYEDGKTVTRDDIEALAGWDAAAEPAVEIAFAALRRSPLAATEPVAAASPPHQEWSAL